MLSEKISYLRKAFREMTDLDTNKGIPRVVSVKGSHNYWENYGYTVSFIDRCVLPPKEEGHIVSMVTVLPDLAKLSTGNINSSIDYVHYSVDDMKDAKKVTEIARCLTVSYPKMNVLFIEGLCSKSKGISSVTILQQLIRGLPKEVILVFSHEKPKVLSEAMSNKFCVDNSDVEVYAYPRSVEIVKTPKGLQLDNFDHSSITECLR